MKIAEREYVWAAVMFGGTVMLTPVYPETVKTVYSPQAEDTELPEPTKLSVTARPPLDCTRISHIPLSGNGKKMLVPFGL